MTRQLSDEMDSLEALLSAEEADDAAADRRLRAPEETAPHRSTLLTVCPFILGNEFCERLAYYGYAPWPALWALSPAMANPHAELTPLSH